MSRYYCALLLAVTAAGCGIFVEDGPWDLLLGVGVAGEQIDGDVALAFPDGASRDNSSAIELWALEPQGTRCRDMLEGAVGPQDAKELGRLLVQLPLPQGAMLRGLPDRQVLFYAEARDPEGTVLLKGCTTERARKGLGIGVELVCVCQPVPGICAAQQEQPGNGIDDDCDGMTDECSTAADCDDANGCTQDICLDGLCQHSKYPDNLTCSDSDPCTVGDVCLDGICRGEPKNCSDFDGVCLEGICNEGACEAQAASDGTACDDGLWCTVGDSCAAGVCSGQQRDCSDQDEICTIDGCDEQRDECTHVLVARPGEEGPYGDATCTNGKDDDCDGLTDGQDMNCKQCTQDGECDDENACTQDSCTGSQCYNEPVMDGTVCDDGEYCNGEDSCLAGACQVHAGNPCPGPDNDADCSEVCDEQQDDCTALDPEGSICDDGLYCTVSDACTSGECVGQERDCSDSDDCTQDSCDDDTDVCLHELTPKPGPEGSFGEPTCGNGIDDDCDGLTDAGDDDCRDCNQTEGPQGDATCSNNIDDDCDGKTDGADEDCWPASQCSQGSGTIDSRSSFEIGGSPKDIVAADLDGDGILDLAVADIYDKVDVLLGQGDGSFSAVQYYDAGDSPLAIAAADFNSDSNIDLAVANYSSNKVSILMGQGDGTFPTRQEFATGNATGDDHPKSVIVADFNSDTHPDLAVTNAGGFTVGILLGNGDGEFDPPMTFLVDAIYNPCDLVAADFNSDGVTDLAVVSYKAGVEHQYVYVLIGGNNGGQWDGTFSDPPTCKYQVNKGTNSIAAADFNADGITDLVLTHSYLGIDDISILMGQGSGGQWDGTFSVSTFSSGDHPDYVTTGYFNSDCIVDMAVSSNSAEKVRIYLGIGDGTFNGDYYYHIGAEATALTLADFNADGANDIAVVEDDTGTTHDKVYVLLGKHTAK